MQSDDGAHSTEHRTGGASIKFSTLVERRPLAPVEPNTQQQQQQQQRPAQHTPLKQPQMQQHLAAPANAAAKPSPGLLREFFDILSPEMAKAKQQRQQLGRTGALPGDHEESQQLECDETLGPIPIYLDNEHHSHMSFEHTYPQHELIQPSLDSVPNLDTARPLSIIQKSPMSTLLSAVKPAGGNAEQQSVPRGLSFTFTGEISNPLAANFSSAPSVTTAPAAAAAAAPSSTRTASSHRISARAESRNSQDTIVNTPAASPLPPLQVTHLETAHSAASAASPASTPRFSCNECTKSFPSNSALAMHLLVHTGEKPFACPQKGCSKR
jgi:hypothetical protein